MSKMQATITNIKEFHTFTSLLEQFDEIVKFQFSSDGILIQSMGNGHTCFIKTKLDKEYFSHFQCDEKMDLSMSMGLVNSILKKAKRGEQVTISSDGERMQFVIESGLSFDIKLIDLDVEDMDIPELEYDFSTMLNPHVLKDWNSQIVDMTKSSIIFSFQFSSPEDMDTDEDIMRLSSEGDLVTVKKDEKLTFNIKTNPEKVSLGHKSMKIVTSLSSFNKDICMCFQNNMPVEFSFDLNDHGTVECYFAPCVIEEDL